MKMTEMTKGNIQIAAGFTLIEVLIALVVSWPP